MTKTKQTPKEKALRKLIKMLEELYGSDRIMFNPNTKEDERFGQLLDEVKNS